MGISSASLITGTERRTGGSCSGCLVSFIFPVGLASLVIGVLIFFAVRSLDGGLAGILLSSVFSWLLFEGSWAVIRGINDARVTVAAQHRIAGGCLGAILLCGLGGFLLVFGGQVVLGVVIGAIATLINHRGTVLYLSQLLGRPPVLTGPRKRIHSF